MFEKASRLKLRFATKRGNVSTEDLWDLPLTQLDVIYQDLHKQAEKEDTVSLINKPAKVNDRTQLSLDIVKRVYEVRVAEAEARKNAEASAAEKQKLLALLAEKDDEALKGMSREELQKKIDELS